MTTTVRLAAGLILTAFLAFGCAPADTHFSQARKYRQQGDWAEAVQEYTQALEVTENPREKVGGHLQRGYALMQMGNWEEAYADLAVARTMACWITKYDPQISADDADTGTLAMYTACDEFTPKYMKEADAHLTEAQKKAALAKALDSIPPRYLKPRY